MKNIGAIYHDVMCNHFYFGLVNTYYYLMHYLRGNLPAISRPAETHTCRSIAKKGSPQ